MANSLKARFNGSAGEVVKYAKEFGVLEAMEEYKVKDYIAMLRFLEEQAPGVKFPTAKVATDPFDRVDAFDKLCEAMLRKYTNMDAQLKAQNKRIAELERENKYYKTGRWNEARPAVQAMLSEIGGEPCQ